MGHPCPRSSACSLGGQLCLEEVNGDDEVTALDPHHQIDGIEVGLAVEAASEVRPWVDGGQELATSWAEEAETTVSLFVRPLKLCYQRGNRDFIAETV